MPRALRYHIPDDPGNEVTNEQWREIARLQHWYNSEFIWSCDRIALKRFIIFPNYDKLPDMPYRTAKWHFRKRFLARKIELQDEIAAVRAMEEEGLFSVRWGGVHDNAIASGITRVADNEYNAYLLCEFLLKASMIASDATFHVQDEGRFILPGRAMFRQGAILIHREDFFPEGARIPLETPQVFSVVNPSRFDDHPGFEQNLQRFDELGEDEIQDHLHNHGTMGFGPNYDTAWGDREGLNLQLRARTVVLV